MKIKNESNKCPTCGERLYQFGSNFGETFLWKHEGKKCNFIEMCHK